MSRQPNLFILGAPKCGTTSLARWLELHPDVYVPSVKEPHHYNIDEKQVYYPDRDDYLRLFEGAESARYRLDASVWYLHSQVAVSGILSDCPDARFLVCLRNPVDMAFSLHSQYLNKSGREPISSFEEAWGLSDQRLEGHFVSRLASDPAYLAYKYSCRIGSQSKRLLEQAPEGSVHFVVLDDLVQDSESTLLSILEFLNLSREVPLKVPHENAAESRRFPAFHRGLRYFARAKNSLGIGPLPRRMRGVLDRINTVQTKPQMNFETRRRVTEYFFEEIKSIWEVTGAHYEHWVQCLGEDPGIQRGRNEKTS